MTIKMVMHKALLDFLHNIGLNKGDNLIVHSSLGSLGSVEGGAPTVIRALLNALGEKGTLVMPSFTPEISKNNDCGDLTICFDKENSPTSMGLIPETLRKWRGTQRSNHPQASLIANGYNAKSILNNHPLEWSLARNSPYEKMYNLNFKILLIGVGHNRNSSLHYAESLVSNRRTKTRHFPIKNNGKIEWVKCDDVGDDNDKYFPKIGDELFKENLVTKSYLGSSKIQIMSMVDVVDFAKDYLNKNLP